MTPTCPISSFNDNSKSRTTRHAISKRMIENTAVLVRRIEFTPRSLLVEFNRPTDHLISVTFRMTSPEFAEVSQVMKIISGEIEPEAE
jgi:hypothetical protein